MPAINPTDLNLVSPIFDSVLEQLHKKVKDWTMHWDWWDAVAELTETEQAIYLIDSLDHRIGKGGFESYFDSYNGMYAYETMEYLRAVGATESAQLLEQALEMINPKKLTGIGLTRHIDRMVVSDEIGKQLKPLDDAWLALDGKEDLIPLIAAWIRAKSS